MISICSVIRNSVIKHQSIYSLKKKTSFSECVLIEKDGRKVKITSKDTREEEEEKRNDGRKTE